MKTHFGFFCNDGDYEYPQVHCEKTVCGYDSENVTENYTYENWDLVTCKKCLKVKDEVIASQLEDEEFIVYQMGDMVDFWIRQEDKRINNDTTK